MNRFIIFIVFSLILVLDSSSNDSFFLYWSFCDISEDVVNISSISESVSSGVSSLFGVVLLELWIDSISGSIVGARRNNFL